MNQANNYNALKEYFQHKETYKTSDDAVEFGLKIWKEEGSTTSERPFNNKQISLKRAL